MAIVSRWMMFKDVPLTWAPSEVGTWHEGNYGDADSQHREVFFIGVNQAGAYCKSLR